MALTAQERGQLGAQKRWGAKDEVQSETPLYRITEICYHNDRIYDPAAQPLDHNGDPRPLLMEFEGHPAHYMEPANAAAQTAWDANPPAPYYDPINRMTTLPTDKARV